MKEIHEKEKKEEIPNESEKISKSILSNNSSSIKSLEDDFFSDVKVTGLNDNIEKNKKIKIKEKMEKVKEKEIDKEE